MTASADPRLPALTDRLAAARTNRSARPRLSRRWRDAVKFARALAPFWPGGARGAELVEAVGRAWQGARVLVRAWKASQVSRRFVRAADGQPPRRLVRSSRSVPPYPQLSPGLLAPPVFASSSRRPLSALAPSSRRPLLSSLAARAASLLPRAVPAGLSAATAPPTRLGQGCRPTALPRGLRTRLAVPLSTALAPQDLAASESPSALSAQGGRARTAALGQRGLESAPARSLTGLAARMSALGAALPGGAPPAGLPAGDGMAVRMRDKLEDLLKAVHDLTRALRENQGGAEEGTSSSGAARATVLASPPASGEEARNRRHFSAEHALGWARQLGRLLSRGAEE